jgi:hypothetical protein
MFDGGGPEPEKFRALKATVRESEDAVLRALLGLAESDHPRSAQRAFDEARGDWIGILLRAFETLPEARCRP